MNIKELRIFTPNLKEQISFYQNVLGFRIVREIRSSASFAVGSSVLTFIEKKGATPYHFAFNIPCNKEAEALSWLKSRVEILKEGMNEMLDFSSWNAKAIYFYDHDNNIVEFIARKNLHNDSDKPFDQESILEISEIGVPTDNIDEVYISIHNTLGINLYDGDLDRFCAIGDENGLFICVDKNKKKWYPANDTAYLSNFYAIVRSVEKDFNVSCSNGILEILEQVNKES